MSRDGHGATAVTVPRLRALPRRLRAGDTVAVCTPSGPAAVLGAERFRRGVRALEMCGFTVRVGDRFDKTGHTTGSPADRTRELNDCFTDPGVRGILTSIGGHTANALLPLLDFDAFAHDPKVFVGYSDITALLLGLYARTGVVTFHGPTLMPELGEYPRPYPYSMRALLRAVTEAGPSGRLRPPTDWTDEFLLWDRDDTRPRRRRPHRGWSWLAPGTCEGPLVGGNLETICALAGTEFLPSFVGTVFFWETVSTSLGPIDRALTQLDMIGVTAEIAGMVVGRVFRAPDGFADLLDAHIRDRYGGRGLPILSHVDLGHTDPMLTLPIGVRAVLDSARDTFEVIEPAVRDT